MLRMLRVLRVLRVLGMLGVLGMRRVLRVLRVLALVLMRQRQSRLLLVRRPGMRPGMRPRIILVVAIRRSRDRRRGPVLLVLSWVAGVRRTRMRWLSIRRLLLLLLWYRRSPQSRRALIQA